jgi:cytochrome c
MRKFCKSLVIAGLTAGLTMFTTACLQAGDDDEDSGGADDKKVADEALTKAIAKGSELFHSKDLGKKSCASCHENPDKPNINLATRPFAYPAYSKRAKAVVTMPQKINEMMKFSAKGKEFDHAGTDIAAIEAYIVSLRKK